MLVKILIVIGILLAIFAVIIAMQPDEFRVSRSAIMAVPAEEVFAQVNDFHNWNAWSPWAKIDPKVKKNFSGPNSGTGAVFQWAGNKEAGEGSMTIIDSVPNKNIVIKLDFIKPFKGTNITEFTFVPQDKGTLVTWTMTGPTNFLTKAIGLVMNCEKMVGGMFEKGLASMKAIVETDTK